MPRQCMICKSLPIPFLKRSFHIFPKGELMRNKWIESLNLTDKNINFKTAHICSDHFDENAFYEQGELHKRRRLQLDAVPQLINIVNPFPVENEGDSEELLYNNTLQNTSIYEETNIKKEEISFINTSDLGSDVLQDTSVQSCLDKTTNILTFDTTDETCPENFDQYISNCSSQIDNNLNKESKPFDAKLRTKLRFMTGFKTEYMYQDDFVNEEAWNKFLRYTAYQKSNIKAAHNKNQIKEKKIKNLQGMIDMLAGKDNFNATQLLKLVGTAVPMAQQNTEDDSGPTSECRTCLQPFKTNSVSYYIFDRWTRSWNGMGNNIAEDLIKLADVQATTTDSLSKIICSTCSQMLLTACMFRTRIRENDEIRRKRQTEDAIKQTEEERSEWPKPIEEKSVIPYIYEAPVKTEIKQELDPETEYSIEITNVVVKEEIPDLDIVKIELEDVIQQEPSPIQEIVNDVSSSDDLNNDASYLTSDTGGDGEEVHETAQHSPKSTKREEGITENNLLLDGEKIETSVESCIQSSKECGKRKRKSSNKIPKTNAQRQQRFRQNKKKIQEGETLDAILARKRYDAERSKRYRDRLKLRKQLGENGFVLPSEEHVPTVLIEAGHVTNCEELFGQTNQIQPLMNDGQQVITPTFQLFQAPYEEHEASMPNGVPHDKNGDDTTMTSE